MLPRWLSDLDEISLKIYQFIEYKIVNEQRPPTLSEIGEKLYFSKSTVKYHLRILEDAQLIRCEPNIPCGIKLLKSSVQGIPLVGRIAAGEPLEIFTEPDQIDMGRDLYGEDIYALQVKGWSMVEDLISDGDYIAIQRQHTYAKNDIIVAVHLSEPSTATLKRFFQERDQIRLEPSNSTVNPIFIPKKVWKEEWEVQGKVIRVSRTFANPGSNWWLNRNKRAAK